MATGGSTRKIPTQAEVLEYFDSLSNWGRWGPDDQLGTLNYITPEKRLAASGLVQKGITVGCARMIQPEDAADNYIQGVQSPIHIMTATPAYGGGSGDFVAYTIHALNMTHIDTHSHVMWNYKSYNGLEAKDVTNAGRSTRGGVQILEDGIVTRGVLLDVAKVKGVEWMGPGEGIFPDDLEAAEEAAGIKVQPGDILLHRTGWAKAREAQGSPNPPAQRPGLHAACLPWLHERGVAAVFADASVDVDPSGYEPPLGGPIHPVGITAMGLWILDCGNFEKLAETCNRENRWEFMFVIAPLRWRNATGSAVNPIAIF